MARIERMREMRARQWLGATVHERAAVSPMQQGDYRDAVLEWLADRVARLETEVAALREALETEAEELPDEDRCPEPMEQADECTTICGEAVIEGVARHFGLAVDALKGDGRTQRLVTARHVACWLLRRVVGGHSLSEIGLLLGRRDHTTVLHSIRRVERDADLQAEAARIAEAHGWALATQEAA